MGLNGKIQRKRRKENSNCDFCKNPIWVRTGIYTDYHGNTHDWNDMSKKEPCAYTYLIGNKSGKCCVECFEKLEKTKPCDFCDTFCGNPWCHRWEKNDKNN